jgi:multidrug resistance efflux pump
MKRYFLWAIVAAVVGLALASLLRRSDSAIVTQPLPEQLHGSFALVQTRPPISRAFPVELDGEVVAEGYATLRAPSDGVLRSLSEHNDEQVDAGAVLATLDSAALTEKRLDNDSKVEELRATLALYSESSSPTLRKLQALIEGERKKHQYAQASFEKLEALFERGLVSGRERTDVEVQLQAERLALQASEREYAEAKSLAAANFLKISNQLQVAQMERQQLLEQAARLVIKAPFAGLLRRYAPPETHDSAQWTVNDSVKEQQALFYLESAARQVVVSASKEVLGYFAVGDSVSVQTNVDGTLAYPGVVQSIVSAPYEAGAGLSTEHVAQVHIAVPAAAFAHLKSQPVKVIKSVAQQGVAVPVAAISSMRGEHFVYLKPCDDSGSFYTRRRIQMSGEEDGLALITAGLAAGECVAQVKGAEQ